MTHDVSDVPVKAPANFASLPPFVQLDDRTWHGSGFKDRDVLAPGEFVRSDLQSCAACRSQDTRCIYLRYFHHIVESEIIVEVVCNACSKFTLHEFIRL